MGKIAISINVRVASKMAKKQNGETLKQNGEKIVALLKFRKN
jgi:hypothetical protein